MNNNLEQVFLGEDVELTSSFVDLAEFDGELYFSASSDRVGEELFVTDGTTEGTRLVADINPFMTSAYNLPPGSGEEFSTSNSEPLGSDPRNFIEFNSRLYFTASIFEGVFGGFGSEEAQIGEELFVTDGTTEGTQIVQDIFPGVFATRGGSYYNSSSPNEFTEFNGRLYFSADSQDGRELFVTDGTTEGTQLVANINPSRYIGRYSYDLDSNPNEFTEFNGQLYFAATSGNGEVRVLGEISEEGNGEDRGRELFVTDGTTEGTILFADLNPGGGDSDPRDLTVFNNRLYFAADDGASGSELYVSDGTVEGTRLFADLNPGAGNSAPRDLTVFDDRLYFVADNGASGQELFVTDGTAEGTELFADINPGGGSSNPIYFTEFNNQLYFVADNGASGQELFVTDGTAEGTELVTDINPGGGSSNPIYFTEFNNQLYFVADNGALGQELFVTDGSAEGTQLVADINLGSGSSNPNELTIVGDELFLTASDDGSNRLLFKLTSDTSVTQPLNPITQPLNPITQPLNPIVGTDFDDEIIGTQDDDGITGGPGNDVLSGRAGNDALDGGAGNDALDGGIGTDTAVYQFAPAGVNVSLVVEGDAGVTATDGYGNTDSLLGLENAIGSEFDDNLTGNSNSNSLTGRGGNDGIVGGGGDDFLTGGLGTDNLTGGLGSDRFVYLDASEGGDTISDFAVGTDKIALLASGFGGGSAGELPASSFAISNGATTSEQRLIFDRSSSELSFDADGSGSSPQQLIATLNGVSDPSAADIVLI